MILVELLSNGCLPTLRIVLFFHVGSVKKLLEYITEICFLLAMAFSIVTIEVRLVSVLSLWSSVCWCFAVIKHS
jgi:hypothetical protein